MMMHLEVIQPGHMVAKGHALLAALMASQKWPLDLVIRESIQNSLDAAKPDVPQVNVGINLLEHSEDDLKAIDKEIKDIVNESAEFAKTSPEPDLSELWTDIYAEAN